MGESAITVQELETEMVRFRGLASGPFDDPQTRRALLEDLVRRKAVEVAARREGYAEHPEVQRILADALVAKYLQDQLEPSLADVAVSEEAIESHYREHVELYSEPMRARGAVILVAVPDGASPGALAELEAKAESIRVEAAQADERQFAALARRHSEDRGSRYVGGEIGWVRQGGRPLRWGEAVVDALLDLERPGDVGPLVRGNGGLYVVRLLERAEARLRPLDTFRAGIRHELMRQRREALRREFYANLMSALEVEVDFQALEAVDWPARTASPRLRPPRLPGVPDPGPDAGAAEPGARGQR